eukprot:scaffold84845_cov44-Phaeocystis_antarctica.AAC.1
MISAPRMGRGMVPHDTADLSPSWRQATRPLPVTWEAPASVNKREPPFGTKRIAPSSDGVDGGEGGGGGGGETTGGGLASGGAGCDVGGGGGGDCNGGVRVGALGSACTPTTGASTPE